MWNRDQGGLMLMNTQWDFCERDDAVLIKPKNGRLDFSNSLDLEKHLDVFDKKADRLRELTHFVIDRKH